MNELTETPRTGTVLVVDDDEGVRIVMARWLESLGHQVRVARDAQEALLVLAAFPIDVALCDIRMPGQDGVWLSEQVWRNHPQTAVIFATGLDEIDLSVTRGPGVAGYIMKPFNRDELAAVIQQGLAANRARKSTPS